MKILEKLTAALKTSGRKQAAFDFRRDVFDWRKVALRLSEIRGGIKALARFAQTYNTALYEPTKPDKGTDEE